jgi:hypothetical protein
MKGETVPTDKPASASKDSSVKEVRDRTAFMIASPAFADSLAWQAGKPSTIGTAAPQVDRDVFATVGVDQEQLDALLPRIGEDFAASEMPW